MTTPVPSMTPGLNLTSTTAHSTQSFLSSVLEHLGQDPMHLSRPHVTLTFAQSLDGKIAGTGGKQLILSGHESMVMTHWMRTMHDAILVGIGTALNDDPQLNTRHLPPSEQPYHQPRPVILDTHLRLSPTCKLLSNYQQGKGSQPWVICGQINTEDEDRVIRRQKLGECGAEIISMPLNPVTGSLDLITVLRLLRERSIRSLMVEGGQRIISSFLQLRDQETPVVDTLIVTVAPKLVGSQGVAALEGDTTTPKLEIKGSAFMGCDAVMALRIIL